MSRRTISVHRTRNDMERTLGTSFSSIERELLDDLLMVFADEEYNEGYIDGMRDSKITS